LLGYFLGRNLPLLDRVTQALGVGGAVVIGAFIVGLIAFWLIRRRREAQTTARAHADTPAAEEATKDTEDVVE
jgi:membrane associated rhomboid family serine protease